MADGLYHHSVTQSFHDTLLLVTKSKNIHDLGVWGLLRQRISSKLALLNGSISIFQLAIIHFMALSSGFRVNLRKLLANPQLFVFKLLRQSSAIFGNQTH
jgi:hypothetical protein